MRLRLLAICLLLLLPGCMYDRVNGWGLNTESLVNDVLFGWIPDHRTPEQKLRDDLNENFRRSEQLQQETARQKAMTDSIPDRL